MFKIQVHRETLTDDSNVYRVALVDDGQTMAEFDAYTERDAESLADDMLTSLQRYALLDIADRVEFTY